MDGVVVFGAATNIEEDEIGNERALVLAKLFLAQWSWFLILLLGDAKINGGGGGDDGIGCCKWSEEISENVDIGNEKEEGCWWNWLFIVHNVFIFCPLISFPSST